MAPGKLVKDEHFTLFEAVSALEVRLRAAPSLQGERLTKSQQIGDPKMDSGSLAFDADNEEPVDLTTALPPDQILWLMDQLLYREVGACSVPVITSHNSQQATWHMGYPLSQTLFTSIHLDRLLWPEPKRLSEARFCRDTNQTNASPSLLLDLLEPFCVGLVKCCDLVLSMVTSQHYYEV